jgi:TrpR-related protein YerC/YecD
MSRDVSAQQAGLKDLFEILSKLESPQEVRDFLVDLCTPSELIAMSGRWQVAKLVKKGLSYREISESTGASTATITRVGRSIQYGRGYQKILQGYSESESK